MQARRKDPGPNVSADPRDGEYSEIRDDADWMRSDARGEWGSDDTHNDMIAFVPSDPCLIEWRCGPGRQRWVARAELYNAGECPEYGKEILKRVRELDARFASFGRPEEAK